MAAALVSVDLLKAVVDSAALLLASAAREIVQSALGLVKAILSAFGDTTFPQFLKQIVCPSSFGFVDYGGDALKCLFHVVCF